jgi:hypothetical protein
MTWTVAWAPLAEDDLLLMPWQDAERVDAAVQDLAVTGRGFVRRIETEDDGTEWRLYAKPYYARIAFDHAARVIHVHRVFPLPRSSRAP